MSWESWGSHRTEQHLWLTCTEASTINQIRLSLWQSCLCEYCFLASKKFHISVGVQFSRWVMFVIFISTVGSEVARPMSPVYGLILLSPLYNWQVINLGWCWLYTTMSINQLSSQIQGWSTSLCTPNALCTSRWMIHIPSHAKCARHKSLDDPHPFARSTRSAQASTIQRWGSVHNGIVGLINWFGTTRAHIQRDSE